jgi:glycosyltransferase involved in cell wall biosynthesis
VAVIPNPVSFPLPSDQPIAQPPNPRGCILLAVGRLHPQKGFDLLIAAFGQLAARYPNWNLYIVGEGNERQALEAQVAVLGLQGRILIPGRIGNLGDWYAAADLYVMSSRFEGFPNTLLEAMAYGLPVISFDCDTGPRDIIRSDADGLLIPPSNLPALVQALDQLMQDTLLRNHLGQAAADAKIRFSIAEVDLKWTRLFEDLLYSKNKDH